MVGGQERKTIVPMLPGYRTGDVRVERGGCIVLLSLVIKEPGDGGAGVQFVVRARSAEGAAVPFDVSKASTECTAALKSTLEEVDKICFLRVQTKYSSS